AAELLRAEALARLAEDEDHARAGVRGRRIHRSAGLAPVLRFARPWPLRRQETPAARWAGGQRVRPAHPARRLGKTSETQNSTFAVLWRARQREGRPLVEAQARRAGEVHRVDTHARTRPPRRRPEDARSRFPRPAR